MKEASDFAIDFPTGSEVSQEPQQPVAGYFQLIPSQFDFFVKLAV